MENEIKENSKWIDKYTKEIIRVSSFDEDLEEVKFNLIETKFSLIEDADEEIFTVNTDYFLSNFDSLNNQIEVKLFKIIDSKTLYISSNKEIKRDCSIFIQNSKSTKVQSRVIQKILRSNGCHSRVVVYIPFEKSFVEHLRSTLDDPEYPEDFIPIIICDHHARLEAHPVEPMQTISEENQKFIDESIKPLTAEIEVGSKWYNQATELCPIAEILDVTDSEVTYKYLMEGAGDHKEVIELFLKCFKPIDDEHKNTIEDVETYNRVLTAEEIKEKFEKTEAKKFDTDKPRYELLPPEALEEIAKVLTYGAKKYDARNWEKGIVYGRLFRAAMRHMWAWLSGEDKDPESGLTHLAHAACSIMFLIHHQYWKVELASDLDDRSINKKPDEGCAAK